MTPPLIGKYVRVTNPDGSGGAGVVAGVTVLLDYGYELSFGPESRVEVVDEPLDDENLRTRRKPEPPSAEGGKITDHEFWKPRVRLEDRCAHIIDNVDATECGQPASAHASPKGEGAGK